MIRKMGSSAANLEAEKVHAELYGRAKTALAAGKDADLADLWVCPVCGYTMEGTPPDACPICATKKEKFVRF